MVNCHCYLPTLNWVIAQFPTSSGFLPILNSKLIWFILCQLFIGQDWKSSIDSSWSIRSSSMCLKFYYETYISYFIYLFILVIINHATGVEIKASFRNRGIFVVVVVVIVTCKDSDTLYSNLNRWMRVF